MSLVQLLVELPPGMSPLRLREVLEMSNVGKSFSVLGRLVLGSQEEG